MWRVERMVGQSLAQNYDISAACLAVWKWWESEASSLMGLRAIFAEQTSTRIENHSHPYPCMFLE